MKRCLGTSGARALGLLTDFLGDGDLAAAFNGKWHANVAAALTDGVALKRTVRATLAALASAGHRMAVVTSTHEAPARRHLQQAGLLAHFEVVTGGDQVSANKPDPAPYRETAAALGLDPARCAAFEDSDPGITAATQAGWRAVQVPDVRPAHAPLPDLGQQVASTVWEAVALFGVLPKDQTNAVAS
ncbi:HAD family phosphatase [uncultured Tateyamaria sp.]|uniref:HAD family hydrolase n=1 Tax=uncultured Tateyamaria sp. TaxID=455651 RepID=UPI00260CC85C|nr:HAD family hydrolase [uncultured Tateyamaria sp.]